MQQLTDFMIINEFAPGIDSTSYEIYWGASRRAVSLNLNEVQLNFSNIERVGELSSLLDL